MSAVALAAIFFVVWWVVLFAVLPWGIRTQDEEGDVVLGTAHSAPIRPMLVRKAAATTIVAAVVVLAFWVLVDVYGFDLDWMARLFGPEA